MALSYQFSSAVSLFFVGVPAGIGVREAIFYLVSNIEFKEIEILQLLIQIRLYNFVADLMFGIYGFTKVYLKK